VSLLAQASVSSQKALAYFEICPFSVNYESVMFYDTGPGLYSRCFTFFYNFGMAPES
jgi:hypothetical protein